MCWCLSAHSTVAFVCDHISLSIINKRRDARSCFPVTKHDCFFAHVFVWVHAEVECMQNILQSGNVTSSSERSFY